jgi:hypothetical protein
MKLKKQKLTLGKSTIANLNDLKLANVYGGAETDGCTFTDCCTFDFTNCKLCQIELTDADCTTTWSVNSACFTETSCRCTTYC